MVFLTLGISHKTAPVSLREQVSFAPERLSHALQDAMGAAGLNEVAILSTCNRTELYCASVQPLDHLQPPIVHWLSEYHCLNPEHLQHHTYVYQSQAAVSHAMRVACGLDSLVLGEPQILGQMKSAYAFAANAGTVGPHLNRLFQTTFTIAKKVRTETQIGQNAISVGYVAVDLAKQLFTDLESLKVLVLGAGDTIELVSKHLLEHGVKHLMVANRTLPRAEKLAQQFAHQAKTTACLLEQIDEVLIDADIVIASTGSQLPVLSKQQVESALHQRRRIRKGNNRPILMIDIAVPRDIAEDVNSLDDVYLYNIDDLQGIIQDNLKAREHASQQAHRLVLDGTTQFMEQYRSLDAVETVKAYRHQADQIRQIELDKALAKLNKGDPPDAVLHWLSRSLTNKLLHTPSVELKKASADGQSDVLSWAKKLFGLAHHNDHH